MRWMKWTGLGSAILLIFACWNNWVTIRSQHITVSGMDATGIGYGRPGYLHLVFIFFFILFSFLPKIWAKRFNLVVVALNLAWAIRNYMMISACNYGDCPVKHFSLYLVVAASLVMLVAALFPDMELPLAETEKK